MNEKIYWKQRLPLLLLHFLCMLALAAFLLANGNRPGSILLILIAWILILAAYLWKSCRDRKALLEEWLTLAGQLEERYLIAEVMEKPERADDQVFYQLLKMAGKSMLEQIGVVRREHLEYREQVEQWVHEIKTPLTAIKLLCENRRSDLTRELLPELEKINRFVEQALCYARSEHTEKDYSVREIRLFDAVHQAIAENKYLLLQNGVRIDLQETDDIVYSDEKWICFILNQLIVNSVKYRTEQPVLKFYAAHQEGRILLSVEDNGIGIDPGDLPRIFEKGFTGSNGRNAAQNATGLGLYLCRQLCDRLEIGLSADSSNQGTTVRLSFSVNDFIRI
ncbi:MAG: sensor histidine kinase [Roseburia sp.]|nr:sensor histidine kinase [Roseburia sp.]MCM1098911.1 sensor histidine kinase [Ruminococcus flavefaciens]